MTRRFALLLCLLLPLAVVPLSLPATAAGQQGDMPPTVVDRIKEEGMKRSQVMQTLSHLSDVIGPRLTASPNMKRANEWTRDRMAGWGMQNAHLEAWGPFGRGWELKRFSAQVIEPQAIPLIAFPKAWCPGTEGALTAGVVFLDVKTEADLSKYRGKLKGAIVLLGPMPEVKAHFEPPGERMTEKELLDLANAGAPAGGRRGRRFQMTPERRAQFALAGRKLQFATEEGAALLMEPSRAGDGGTIFVQSATVPQATGDDPFAPGVRRLQPWDKDAPHILPQVVVAVEQFNRMVRMLQAGENMRMTVDLDVRFHDQDLMGYNTVAEIPGTDLKDEVVMLGGHMDSWHGGTGATDNGAGSAVAMEAARILQALKLQPRRTVRVGLWSGEEEGLLGSRAYVAQHFGQMEGGTPGAPGAPGTPGKLTTKPEYEKFDAYFNLDNGTGKIRGVYMQGNDAVRPIFRNWLTPFHDVGADTLTLSNTGGTDHLSFDGIGLPGFQFIQDPIEYETRTHHSNEDVFDRIQEEDLKQASTIMAAFVYQTAMLDQKLPRKPRP